MHSIINLDKPQGLTSQQAVSRVKRLLGVKKAGHTGTLDPMATGVLLVCLNEATKVSRFLLDKDKSYRTRLKLGEGTDTLDAEGTITETLPVPDLTAEQIAAAVGRFVGVIQQIPPMYSAIKRNGRPLYELARAGVEVERSERTVEIYGIRIIEVTLPFIGLEVSCSKGTYIRTLCADIGRELGTVAHVTELARTAVGPFQINRAVSLEALAEGLSSHASSVISIDEALAELPPLLLDDDACRRAKNGISLHLQADSDIGDNCYVRLQDSAGVLFGIGLKNNEIISIERNFSW